MLDFENWNSTLLFLRNEKSFMSVCFGLCVYLPCQTRMIKDDPIVFFPFNWLLSHQSHAVKRYRLYHSLGLSILFVTGGDFAKITLQKAEAKGPWSELYPELEFLNSQWGLGTE
jgi:hypothetical protein